MVTYHQTILWSPVQRNMRSRARMTALPLTRLQRLQRPVCAADLELGKTYEYTGKIIVVDKGETAPILERYKDKDPSLPFALVQGQVKDSSGKPVPGAFVIISKEGAYKETVKSHGAEAVKTDILQPLVWEKTDAIGKFSSRLPQRNV